MIKLTKFAVLCSLIGLPTHTLARDVNDLGIDVQAATSAYIVKNQNPRFAGSYNGSRLEGWALMSYVVDTQGKAKDIEVIMASDTRGSEENAEKYLTNLEFAPATKEGKTVEGGYLFSFEVGKYFNGTQMIKRAVVLLMNTMKLIKCCKPKSLKKLSRHWLSYIKITPKTPLSRRYLLG